MSAQPRTHEPKESHEYILVNDNATIDLTEDEPSTHEPKESCEYNLIDHIAAIDLTKPGEFKLGPEACAFVEGCGVILIDAKEQLLHSVDSEEGKRLSGYMACNAKGPWLQHYADTIPGSAPLMGLIDHIMRCFDMPKNDGRRCFVKCFLYDKLIGAFPFHPDKWKGVVYLRYCLSLGRPLPPFSLRDNQSKGIWLVMRCGPFYLTIMDPFAAGRVKVKGDQRSFWHGTFVPISHDAPFLVWDGHAETWQKGVEQVKEFLAGLNDDQTLREILLRHANGNWHCLQTSPKKSPASHARSQKPAGTKCMEYLFQLHSITSGWAYFAQLKVWEDSSDLIDGEWLDPYSVRLVLTRCCHFLHMDPFTRYKIYSCG
jgi:hypothetical protein